MSDIDISDVLAAEVEGLESGSDMLDAKVLAKAKKDADNAKKKSIEAERARAKAVESASAIVNGSGNGTSAASNEPARVRNVLPDKEKIRIMRRETDGKLHHINDYSLSEIEADGDVTGFINRRLRTHFGDYDYVVQIIGRDGQARPHTTVPRRDAREDKETTGSLLKTVLETIKEDRQANKGTGESASDRALKTVTDMMIANQGKSFDPMMLMLMPMIKDAMKPSESDSSLAVLTQLADRMDRLERERDRPVVPSFPEMPPVHNDEPKVDLAAMVTAIASAVKPPERTDNVTAKDIIALMETMKHRETDPFTFKDLLATLPAIIPLIDKMSGRDIMQQQLSQLREDIRDRKSAGGITDEFQKLIQLRNLAANFFPQRDSSGSEWLAFAEKLVDVLPESLDRAVRLAKELKADKRSKTRTVTATVDQSTEASEVEEAGTEEDEDSLVLTDDAKEALNKLANAEDEDVLIKAFEFFQVAAASSVRWQKYAGLLVFTAKKKNGGKRVLEIIHALLNSMVEAEALEAEAAERIMVALTDNVKDLVNTLKAAG